MGLVNVERPKKLRAYFSQQGIGASAAAIRVNDLGGTMGKQQKCSQVKSKAFPSFQKVTHSDGSFHFK